MKSVPDIDYKLLQKTSQKPTGKYSNMVAYLTERGGGEQPNEAMLDKKMRTFFEDLITEILKNPKGWDRSKNINFMELFNYLEGKEEQLPQKEQMPQEEGQSQEQQPMKQEGNLKKRALYISDNPHTIDDIKNKYSQWEEIIRETLQHNKLQVIEIYTKEKEDESFNLISFSIMVEFDSASYGGKLPGDINDIIYGIAEKIECNFWEFDFTNPWLIEFRYDIGDGIPPSSPAVAMEKPQESPSFYKRERKEEGKHG